MAKRSRRGIAIGAMALACAVVVAIVPLVIMSGRAPEGDGTPSGKAVAPSAEPGYDVTDSPGYPDVTDQVQVDQSTIGQTFGYENYVKFDNQPDKAAGSELCDAGECESGSVLAQLAPGTSLEDAVGALNRVTGLEGLSAVKQTDAYVKFALPEGLGVQSAIDLMEGASVVSVVQAELLYDDADGDSGEGAQDIAFSAKESAANAQLQEFSAAVVAHSVGGTDLGDALGIVEPQSVALPYPPNDPYWSQQWNLSGTYGLGIYGAWSAVARDTPVDPDPGPVVIAVIDGGFHTAHSDFAANTFVHPRNVTDGSINLTGYAEHGTHVAGIIAAATNNQKAVAGVTYNQCKIMPVKVRDSAGNATTSSLVDAFTYVDAMKNGGVNVRVANISMGHASPYAANDLSYGDFLLYRAITKTYEDGVVTVAAAGNNDSATPPYYEYPGDYDRVISVVNTDNRGARHSSSNYNVSGQLAKGISAPGEGILSLGVSGDKPVSMSGTSMASPMVAGVVGLMLTEDPKLTPDTVISKVYSSTNQAGWSNQTGYGILNASSAVNKGRENMFLTGDPVMVAGARQIVYAGYSDVFGKTTFTSSDTDVDWASSDESVIQVMHDLGGYTRLTALKAGQVTISAKKDGHTAKQIFTVYEDKATLNGDEVVPTKATVKYWAESYPIAEWTYESSNPSIGTIDSDTGKFQARGTVGTTTITATPKSGSPITKSASKTVRVISNDFADSNYSVTLPATSYTYSGRAYTPEPKVRMANTYTLEKGTDYVLGYYNNIDSGTATVSAYGRGDFEGSRSASFAIRKAPMSSANIWLSATSFTYDGSLKAPTVRVYDIGSRSRNALASNEYSVAIKRTALGTGTVTITATSACRNFTGSVVRTFTVSPNRVSMFRLYNPNSGEHFYTANAGERNFLKTIGWRDEGVGWTAPHKSASPVYRLYNPNEGDHHYTLSASERSFLIRIGWRDEGVGWYSDDLKRVPLYREFNPNVRTGSHNYTTSRSEHNYLVKIGWRNENIAWYGM